MVKIVHCADIHLDSPFILNDPRNAELRRMEHRAAFTSLILHAKNIGARIFLISGDLFDEQYLSKDTADLLYKEIARFSECKFFIAPGDHDFYHSKSPYKALRWPENVHVFKSNDITKIEVPELNVDIYGYAFTDTVLRHNPFSNKKPQNPQRINILIGHGDMSSPDSECCPIKKSDLDDNGFDYIALGHLHMAPGIIKRGGAHICYPGCLEGRNFDEPGYKGAMCGDISKESCDIKGVRFSKRRYETEELDITGYTSERQIMELIKRQTAQFGEDTAVKIILNGKIAPEFTINPMDFEAGLSDLYFAEIEDNTELLINYSLFEEDKTLKGIFYRKIKDRLHSEDTKIRRHAEKVFKYGLCAFAGLNITE